MNEAQGIMREFTLTKVEGEYAYLTDEDSKEELFIAMALLPLGSDIGSRLVFDGTEFSFKD